MYSNQKVLIDQWCKATVEDAVRLFHFARIQPVNETEPLEKLAVKCANSAFQHVAETIIGDKDSTAKRYGELCYERFKREIPRVIVAAEVKEVIH
jgi:hypothetical protein